MMEIDRLEAPHPASSPSMQSNSAVAKMCRPQWAANARLVGVDRFMGYPGGGVVMVDSLPRDLDIEQRSLFLAGGF